MSGLDGGPGPPEPLEKLDMGAVDHGGMRLWIKGAFAQCSTTTTFTFHLPTPGEAQ